MLLITQVGKFSAHLFSFVCSPPQSSPTVHLPFLPLSLAPPPHTHTHFYIDLATPRLCFGLFLSTYLPLISD